MPDRNNHRRAIVIGASMAGLATARVLADHVSEVILLERDRIPRETGHRKGVPQARHVHVLLVRGRQVLERLFPGLEAALVGDGAVPYDELDLRLHRYGTCRGHGRSGVEGLAMSRPLLEHHVRRRVLGLPNVRLADGCAAERLLASPDRTRVTGVAVRDGDGIERNLPADLVVDASGRGSRTPRWLEALGCPRPPESEVRIDVGYATRIFRRPPDRPAAWGLVYSPTPPDRRGGVLLPLEGDRWMATLGGWHGDHAPTDEHGWLAFARSLATRELHDAVARAEPLSDIITHRQPSNLRRHYERAHHFPERLLVVGDAVASFNPVYGQGMTIAALEAEALGAILARRGNLDGLAAGFRHRVAGIADVAWGIATTEDFGFAQTTGPRSAGGAILRAYGRKVLEAAAHDLTVATAMARVMHLLDPPSKLLRPSVLGRVAFSALRRPPSEAASPESRAPDSRLPAAAGRLPSA